MKVRSVGLCLALILNGLSGGVSLALAEEMTLPGEFSATVNITSDYVYRGVSQTNEDIAVQSSLDWNHESGLYLGMWATNVDFGDGTELEMDIYGGFASEVAGISYDVMVLGYLYPGARAGDQDFIEFSLGLGYDAGFASANVGLAVSPEWYGNSGVGTYIYGGVAVPIPIGALEGTGVAFSIDANFGYQDLADASNFVHYDVGLGIELLGFALDVRYVGNDIDDGSLKVDDDRVVFGISREF